MAIEIRCPKCDRQTRLPLAFSDERMRCEGCGVWLRVPKRPSAAEISATEMSSGEIPVAAPVNPFETPQVLSRAEPAAAVDEPIDFQPFFEESATDTAAVQPRRAALALSDRQLRDALNAASSTRGSVDFLAVLLFISLVRQGFAVVVSFIMLVRSVDRGLEAMSFVWLAVNVGSAIITGVSAVLLKNYGSTLKEFVQTREPNALVESLVSGSRYWLWSVAMIIVAIGVMVVLVFAAMATTA